MIAHSHHLWNYGFAGPFHTKYLSQFLEVVSCGLANGEDSISEPAHTQGAEFFIEELHAKLTSEQGNVLNDSQAHSPLLVFGQLDDCRQERLREQIDADDWEKKKSQY